jgi:hypothetical protein
MIQLFRLGFFSGVEISWKMYVCYCLFISKVYFLEGFIIVCSLRPLFVKAMSLLYYRQWTIDYFVVDLMIYLSEWVSYRFCDYQFEGFMGS